MNSALFVTTVSRTLRAFLLPFAQNFRAQGWRVDAVASEVSECDDCRQVFDNVYDIAWSRDPKNPANLLNAPRIIRDIVEHGEYDIVHVHTPIAAFVTRYALRGLRGHRSPRIIYTAHGFHFYEGGPAFANSVFLGMERLAGRWTDDLVVMNHEDYEAAHRYHIMPGERIHYMHGIGVDTELFSPDRILEEEVARVRTEMGINGAEPLFLMVGEFIPRKRHHDVLEAFARLKHSHAHLALAGRGSLRTDMEALADRLGIANKVHFLGYRKDIPSLAGSSQAVLLPSAQEGLPRSVMESLSLSVPVIGSDIRGTRDLLADGCGLLTRVGDIDGLAEAMVWILEHPDEAKLMGQRGRMKMKGEYDIRNIVKLHERLYYEALGVDYVSV